MDAPALPSPHEDERAHHALAARLAGLELAELARPEHRDLVLRGLRLHLLDWGRAGRPPALFLHGGGQTARTWDLPCLALRDTLHCLALDQRGHGDSEWAYDFAYDPDDHAGDFAALLDRLEIPRAVVVGMSMGCINGLHFAARWPERVAAFVAVDAGPWVRLAGGARIVDFVQGAAAEGGPLEAWVERALRFNPRRDPRLLRRSLLHNLRQLRDGTLTWKTDRRRPFDLAAMAERLDTLRELVPRISCPVLVLRGSESDVLGAEEARRFAQALPDGRWREIPGAGHTIQGDQPAALVEAIRAFLHEQAIV